MHIVMVSNCTAATDVTDVSREKRVASSHWQLHADKQNGEVNMVLQKAVIKKIKKKSKWADPWNDAFLYGSVIQYLLFIAGPLKTESLNERADDSCV